jgi:tetratricopeptide (TPR) repeat protein
LISESRQQVRQLTAAAENAWLAGGLDRALALLERARPIVSDPIERADIDRWRGLIEMNQSRPADAYQVLIRAADEVTRTDRKRALDLLNLAGLAAAYGGDGEAQAAVGEAAGRLAVEDDGSSQALAALLVGIGAHARGDFDSAVPKLRLALQLAQKLSEPTVAVQVGTP